MSPVRFRRTAFACAFSVAVALSILIAIPGRTRAADAGVSLVDRGAYLVGDAGQCSDCHGAGLVGGPAPKGPPGVPWATMAPSLVGLKMFTTDADAVKFLSTNVLPDGAKPLPPMPHYKFHTEDATAIVAYLRSLK